MSIHIFISFDSSDAKTAADIQRQLALVLQPEQTVFWNKNTLKTEHYRNEAAVFLEGAHLFIAVLSQNYEDKPDIRWEAHCAVQTQVKRPVLQIMTVEARPTATPVYLRPFISGLPDRECIELQAILRDRQLKMVAERARQILLAAPPTNEMGEAKIVLPLLMEDVIERLVAQTDRINHAPLISVLKRMIEDVQVKRVVMDIEEGFQQLREKTRLSQVTMQELKEQARPVQIDLQHLVENLKEEHMVPNWRMVFIRDYFRFTDGHRESGQVPPFFVPMDEIAIPETLNLPVGPSEQEALEKIGLLSFEQKSEFRRRLLLAKDALAVNNYTQAYAHGDFVRSKIDPQSAQLYEFLMISFIQQETPQRILHDVLDGNPRLLNFLLMFASRYREYQREGKCPSSMSNHNLAIASEAISDAALQLYHQFPNDPVLHTGKHLESVPDNRKALRLILGNTLRVCRLVYPSEELLEAAVIESCGGGKCAWIQRVDVVGDFFRFMPSGHFDLLGEIRELLDMLQQMEADDPDKIVKDQTILREDLYFSLMVKHQKLMDQLTTDGKRQRPFTDVRLSVIRLIHSCLLGHEVFGELADTPDRSFLRLALEYLMPDLLVKTEHLQIPNLIWFDFDEEANLISHPLNAEHQFDAKAIIEKIIRDHSGKSAWIHVQPNIKESVWKQYVADTEILYEQTKKGFEHTDFRRPDLTQTRTDLIIIMRRWRIAGRVYPDRNQLSVTKCIHELSGNGLLLWAHHNPDLPLVTQAESLVLGFDALAELKALLPLSDHYTDEDLRRDLAGNLFQKRIIPALNAIKKGDESKRHESIRLLRETLSNYQLYPDLAYLDLVWRELTEEPHFKWIRISKEGVAQPYADHAKLFDPLEVLAALSNMHPQRYKPYDLRERIATRRHADVTERYFEEISEFKIENRQPERAIGIEIIHQLKGIFTYFPKDAFLELAFRELEGKGRIRWHANFLGVFPTRENHYENSFYNFNYRFELFEVKRMLENQYEALQGVMRETGEL